MPHVLAIPVGSTVDFPNLDPIFHNAFSNFSGQPFDVGLYPPGTSRRRDLPARRHRARLLQHPPHHERHHRGAEHAVVRGHAGHRASSTSTDVPPGEYQLRIFHERAAAGEPEISGAPHHRAGERADAAADLHFGDRLHSGAAPEQVRQGLSAGDQRRHLSGSASNEAAILAAVAAVEDPALHLGGDHRAVRHHRQIVLRNITKTMSDSLEEEVQASFQAYTSLWKSRAELLASVSRIMSQHVGRARRVQHRRPGHHPRHRRRTVVARFPTPARIVPGDRPARQGDRVAGRRTAPSLRKDLDLVRSRRRAVSRSRRPASCLQDERACTRSRSRRSTCSPAERDRRC